MLLTDQTQLRFDLVERVVTVTGEGVETPHNYLTPVGTPIEGLLQASGLKESANKVIFGGPMMGVTLPCIAGMPTVKGTNSILVLADADTWPSRACIRCGKCVEVCPMNLIPSHLSIVCESKNLEAMKAATIMECFECGCCTYVCPAKRPIVHLVKFGKDMLKKAKAEEDAKQKAS